MIRKLLLSFTLALTFLVGVSNANMIVNMTENTGGPLFNEIRMYVETAGDSCANPCASGFSVAGWTSIYQSGQWVDITGPNTALLTITLNIIDSVLPMTIHWYTLENGTLVDGESFPTVNGSVFTAPARITQADETRDAAAVVAEPNGLFLVLLGVGFLEGYRRHRRKKLAS